MLLNLASYSTLSRILWSLALASQLLMWTFFSSPSGSSDTGTGVLTMTLVVYSLAMLSSAHILSFLLFLEFLFLSLSLVLISVGSEFNSPMILLVILVSLSVCEAVVGLGLVTRSIRANGGESAFITC